tara:strand:+ start:405 stop:800 length:396 start_codon:yes stop_codon:yes gene_type:complete
MWFSLAKMAMSTGAKVYANKQRQKEAMSQAALRTAEKMANGEMEYQGKLLEARQTDLKDEFVLIILSAPILILAWAVFSDNPDALEKVKVFFKHFQELPTWFTSLWVLVVASIFGIKGTQVFRNGGGIKKK